jgi:acetyl esterase
MALDPDAERVLALLATARPPLDLALLDAAGARERSRAGRAFFAVSAAPVAEVRDIGITTPAGPLALRLYRPAGSAPEDRLPVLLYLHGGGWVAGDLESHDGICRQLANAAGCAVVAVDYRRAPEHKFPAALEDAVAALRWLAGNADRIGLDGGRLAVGGDSAGGNLAAAACLALRDGGGPALRLQLLIYPSTDCRQMQDSYARFATGFGLSRAEAQWYRAQYLRGPEDALDPRASPLLAPRLAGLPPAFLLTAGHDIHSDEGEAYAERLRQEGVPVKRCRFEGQIHGFFTMGRMIPAARTAKQEAAAALRAAFQA